MAHAPSFLPPLLQPSPRAQQARIGPRWTLAAWAQLEKRVQNGGRNGVFSDGPMGATAPDGFGRKNPVHSWGARTTSSRFRLPAKWGELLGGE